MPCQSVVSVSEPGVPRKSGIAPIVPGSTEASAFGQG